MTPDRRPSSLDHEAFVSQMADIPIAPAFEADARSNN